MWHVLFTSAVDCQLLGDGNDDCNGDDNDDCNGDDDCDGNDDCNGWW